MSKVDQYISSTFSDGCDGNSQIKELKQEMKVHLLDAVNELQAEGKTPEEATAIAIERFGEPNAMTKAILGRFQARIHITKWLFRIAMSFLIASLVIGVGVFLKGQQYNDTRFHLQQLVEAQVGKVELTEQDKVELTEVLENDSIYSKVSYLRLDKREEADAGTVSDSEPMPTFVSEPVFFYGQEEWGLMLGSGSKNQEWGAQWQMRGYESYNKVYLLIPFLFMALAIALFVVWVVLDAANRRRVYY